MYRYDLKILEKKDSPTNIFLYEQKYVSVAI